MSRSFSGTNQYLSIASDLSLTRPYFIGGWWKKSSTGQTATLVLVGVSGTSTNYNRVGWDSSDRINANTHDGTGTSGSVSGSAADTNYHFGGANHGSATSRTAVLDDTFGTENTASRTPAVAADSIFIGVLGNLSQDYAGLGAHIFAVNREITAGERTSLAGGANPRAIFTSAELVFYLPCTANDGSEFTDAVHSNVFTNTGTTFSSDNPTIDALPVFSGTIAGKSHVEDSAITPVDLSGFWTGPGTYSVTSGTLPVGLSLDSGTGIVSGTPTTPGTSTGIVVSKTSGVYVSSSNSFSWAINTASAPGFTVDPVATPTTTGFSIAFTTDGACTAHALALRANASNPADLTAADAVDLEHVSKAVNGADTLVLSTLGGANSRPVYLIVVILTNGTESSPFTSIELRSPITDYALSVASGSIGTDSIYAGASPAVASGDVAEYKATSNDGGYATTLEADGDFIIASGGDTSRQNIPFYFYDVSTDTLEDHATNLVDRFWVRNFAPVLDPELTLDDDFDAVVIRVALDEEITPINGREFIQDDDDAELAAEEDPATLVATPTGISIGATGSITGTPTVAQWAVDSGDITTYLFTDITGATVLLPIAWQVGPRIPTSIADTSEASATAVLEALPVTVAIGTPVYSSSIAEGNVVSTSPALGTIVESGSVVTVYLSLGIPEGTRLRPFSFNWWRH